MVEVPGDNPNAAIGSKRPVMEHKGLFSDDVTFLTCTPRIQRLGPLCKSPLPFSMCLAAKEVLVNEEKRHQNAGDAAKRHDLQSSRAGCQSSLLCKPERVYAGSG
jgi:hypothetical protein